MMNIQWFPGHMTRAKRDVQAMMERVDFVIEIRDARCPMASRNPLVEELIQQKPRLILLNKRDMADEEQTKAWIKHLSAEATVLAIDAHHDEVRTLVVDASMKVMQPKLDRWKAKGIHARRFKAMVLGIPNVGKSTLINQLAKKRIMTTADRPGVTMALKWANVHPKLDILDTPGILWPKFEDPQVGLILALSGAIKESVLSSQSLAHEAFTWLQSHYPNAIQHSYGLNEGNADVFFQVLQDKFGLQTLTLSYERFLRDLKQGRLGPISFEHV